MKKFFSEKIGKEEHDLFDSLLDLIDSRYIRDRNLIVKDIMVHESLKKGKAAQFGNIRVHTARSSGITEFCMACMQSSDGVLEILFLWCEISEHLLEKLAGIVDFFEKNSSLEKSNDEIIAELKKI